MKNKFVYGTFLLIGSGIITKLMGLIIRIVTTRLIGEEGITIYMLVLPTMILFITLSQMGLPIAISKKVAENKVLSRKIILPLVPIHIILNTILIIIIFIIAPYLSENLLHNTKTYLPLIAMTIVIPLVGTSSIIRGYFYGKQRMFPPALAYLIEQLVRLIYVLIIVPPLLKISLNMAVLGLVFGVASGEIATIIVFLLFLPKNANIKLQDFRLDKTELRSLLSISVPATGSKLIGSISYFFEPILITQAMLMANFTAKYANSQYGIIAGYAIPLLLLPSFFSGAISTALIPAISKAHVNKNIKKIKSLLKKAIFFSLLTGGISTAVIYFFPDVLLSILYKTDSGAEYVKILAPFFLVFYFQAPITSTLQACGLAKDAMVATLVGAIIKSVLIFILPILTDLGIKSVAIGIIVNILIVTILHFRTYIKRIYRSSYS